MFHIKRSLLAVVQERLNSHTVILSKAEYVPLSQNLNVISTLDSCNGFLLLHSSMCTVHHRLSSRLIKLQF